MLSILTFILILGIMVFVHELGHFLVCKKVGVRILAFSLGMGPEIIAWQGDKTFIFGNWVLTRANADDKSILKRWKLSRVKKPKEGEELKLEPTRYRIAAIPFGGYLRMLGENPGETDDKIDPKELDRSYWAQSPMKRAAITAAGPFLNIVLALLIVPLSYIIGIEMPSYPLEPTVVQGIVPDSAADKAGFEYGDKIVEVNGKKYKNWEALESVFIMSPDETFKIDFERAGEKKSAEIKIGADEKHGVGVSGFNFYETTVVDVYSASSPAKIAGMQNGDRIISIAGKPIEAFSSIRTAIKDSGGQPADVVVERGVPPNAQTLTLQITPTVTEDEGGKRYIIGVQPHVKTINVKYGPIQATKEGWLFLFDKAIGQFIALKKIVTGKLSTKTISGPIGIGFVIDYARKEGISTLIQITAVISMLLGIINFFPLPALDGGHILMSTIEFVSRRKLPRNVVDFFNFTGFALLIGLMLVVTVKDFIDNKDHILRFFGIN